jgi:hypothetical protein
MDFTTSEDFVEPTREISTPADLRSFLLSETYSELLKFIQACAESIQGYEFPATSSSVSSSVAASTVVLADTSSGDFHGSIHELQLQDEASAAIIIQLEEFLQKLAIWVDEIPPIKQPMRFGNKAFRDWHARLVLVECPTVFSSYLFE